MAGKPRPAEAPNYSPPVFVPRPPDYLPPGVTAREPGRGEMPPPPEQKARRLVVATRDEERAFEFSPDYAGSLTVLGGDRLPSAPWDTTGVLGKFSVFSTREVRIEGGADSNGTGEEEETAQQGELAVGPDPNGSSLAGRRLICVEADGIERIFPIDEQSQSLIVAWSEPDEREPWVIRERTERFSLGELESLALEDV